MNNLWHEQILRYVDGQADAGEAEALQAALSADAELRVLYLDYMNLDVALDAVAEAATVTAHGTGEIAAFLHLPEQSSPHYWRWFAAAAACVAFVMYEILSLQRMPARMPPDVAAACSAARSAIAQLSVEVPAAFPAWASPTAWMLEPPRTPPSDPKS